MRVDQIYVVFGHQCPYAIARASPTAQAVPGNTVGHVLDRLLPEKREELRFGFLRRVVRHDDDAEFLARQMTEHQANQRMGTSNSPCASQIQDVDRSHCGDYCGDGVRRMSKVPR